MTSATFRLVRTAFEEKAYHPGGKKVTASVIDAYANLAGLGTQTLPLFEQGLADIRALVGNGRECPSPQTLRDILSVADNLVGYCLTVNRPGLDEAFMRVARLCDAISHSRTWIPGTFSPLIETIRLALDGSLDLQQVAVLLENIDLCIDRYSDDKN